MKLRVTLSPELLQDALNLSSGWFAPLEGFMTSAQYERVLEAFELEPGRPWPMPVTLDVDAQTFAQARRCSRLYFGEGQATLGFMEIADCFTVNPLDDCRRVFNTCDAGHPGVLRELRRSPHRVGGSIRLLEPERWSGTPAPARTRALFESRGWRTVVGFQTRNPLHRAHEHLLRTCLELFDGVFINPIAGWKKPGDFTEQAVRRAGAVVCDRFLPRDRVVFQELKTSMRYAGPREALFHALIRRNAGCTHFVIGRDHAGVGGYYGRYEAQELARAQAAKQRLGIQLLLLKEPYYCRSCGQVVSEQSCGHDSSQKVEISGTIIRQTLRAGSKPDERLMRPEVAEALLQMGEAMFIPEV